MIYKDSYHTTLGSIYDIDDIKLAIKKAVIISSLDTVNLNVISMDGIVPIYLTNYGPAESDVKVFNHPMSFTDGEKKFLATDLRLVVKGAVDIGNISKSIRNVTEYNFIKARSILNLQWLAGNIGELKLTLPFAGIIYSAWLSDVIAKAYVLDFNAKESLTVASNIFYQSLFLEGKSLSENDKQMIVAHTIKTTKVNSDLVFKIVDQMEDIYSIDLFAKALPEITGSLRLKGFDLTILLTLIRNSWFGNNSKDILGVALELPPTWMALVFTALTERNYKNSTIAKFTDLLGRRNKGDEFVKSFKGLIDESTSNISTESLDDLDFTLV